MFVSVGFGVSFFDEFFGLFNHLTTVGGGAAGDGETGEFADCCACETVD